MKKRIWNTKESYREIAEYFGNKEGWLRNNSYNRHKRILIDKYGVISISSVGNYLKYQEELFVACEKVINSKVLTNKEIREATGLLSHNSFMDSVFRVRNFNNFINLDFINKVEDVVYVANKKLANKLSQIEKEKEVTIKLLEITDV